MEGSRGTEPYGRDNTYKLSHVGRVKDRHDHNLQVYQSTPQGRYWGVNKEGKINWRTHQEAGQESSRENVKKNLSSKEVVNKQN